MLIKTPAKTSASSQAGGDAERLGAGARRLGAAVWLTVEAGAVSTAPEADPRARRAHSGHSGLEGGTSCPHCGQIQVNMARLTLLYLKRRPGPKAGD